MKLVFIIISLVILYLVISEFITVKTLVNKIKIGDKKRIFIDEDKFESVEIMDIYKRGNKKFATCRFVDGTEKEIRIDLLIY